MGAPSEGRGRTLEATVVTRAGRDDARASGSDAGSGPVWLDGGPLQIGRFAVLRQLGRGGMGEVYAAYDGRLGRHVAVKLVREGMTVGARGRILLEAKAMAKLSHPHVVQVFEVGEHEGRLFIAMEFVDGRDLKSWQDEPNRSWREVLGAYLQAGEGLAAAHEAGLIHRDFKPHNVVVETTSSGELRVRVLDFGLARSGGAVPSAPTRPSAPSLGPSATARLTLTGRVMGTPAYMAPEQYEDGAVEATADQFSFCVALWEGLYGHRPFSGKTAREVMSSIRRVAICEPEPSSKVPRRIRDILLRGLAREPEDRFGTMPELLSALRQAMRKRRPLLPTAAVLSALVIPGSVAAVAWAPAGPAACPDLDAPLQAQWGLDRQEEVRAAILHRGLPYAERTWDRVRASTDAYAGRWLERYAAACSDSTEALAAVAHRPDLECLRAARAELGGVTEILAHPDVGVVDHAAEVLMGLPSLSRCEGAGMRQAALPDPEAPREFVEPLAALARADAWRRAGQPHRAAEELEGAIIILPSDDPEVRGAHVRASIAGGELLRAEGKPDEADAKLREALREATALRRWDLALRASLALMDLLTRDLARPEEALRYVDVAEGWALGDEEAEIAVLRARARAWSTAGRHRQAAGAFRTALRHALAHPELRGAFAGALRFEHAQELRLARLRDESGEAFERALIDLEGALGEDHPQVVLVRLALAESLAEQGRLDASEIELRSAYAARLRVFGPDDPAVDEVRNLLALNLAGRGKPAAAEAELRWLLERQRRRGGLEDGVARQTRRSLGVVLLQRGKFDEAKALLGGTDRSPDAFRG